MGRLSRRPCGAEICFSLFPSVETLGYFRDAPPGLILGDGWLTTGGTPVLPSFGFLAKNVDFCDIPQTQGPSTSPDRPPADDLATLEMTG
jgi:hypothetical protein